MKLLLIEVTSVLLVLDYALSCTTPLGQTSQCVSLYDCPDLYNAFERRPLPSSVISFLRQSQCGFEGYNPRVCCGPLPTETVNDPVITQRPRPSSSNSNSNSGRVDPVSSEDAEPAPQGQCGMDQNGDKIYGGQFTDLDEFPWMALLGYRTRNNSVTYQCGGVLINRRYVLTAAHCVTGAVEREVGSLSMVRLGEYDTQNAIDCLDGVCADPPQDIPIQTSLAHPGFNDKSKNRQDDLALVRLSRRANLNYYVQPICLSESSSRLDTGNDVYVAGWGKTLNGRNSPIKLKLKVPIYEKSKCIEKYRKLGAELINNQLCAGGVFAEDACRGDSGGPLMSKRANGIWESVAVVSFGYGCGRDGWPGVYTKVASYKDWIRDTMQLLNA